MSMSPGITGARFGALMKRFFRAAAEVLTSFFSFFDDMHGVWKPCVATI
jgi:hypothetical protein